MNAFPRRASAVGRTAPDTRVGRCLSAGPADHGLRSRPPADARTGTGTR
ncbi:hypothetical protein SZN_27536, partial [Streptomyces zinciresistens K42]